MTARRPAWAALIATVMLSLTALLGTGLWFSAQVRQERDIARTERDRATVDGRLDRTEQLEIGRHAHIS